MKTEPQSQPETVSLVQSENPAKNLAGVQAAFWPSPEFAMQTGTQNDWAEGFVPLTLAHGPHSKRISAMLAKHPSLKEYTSGVDERAIYTSSDGPLGMEHVDWDPNLDGKPVVFGFYDELRRSYEVYCLKIEIDEERGEQFFRIQVTAIVDFRRDPATSVPVELFLDSSDPIQLAFFPTEPSLETDIRRLRETGVYDLSDLLGRLDFVGNTIADGRTQSNPFA